MNVEFTAGLRADVDTMIAGRVAYHALHQAFSPRRPTPTVRLSSSTSLFADVEDR